MANESHILFELTAEITIDSLKNFIAKLKHLVRKKYSFKKQSQFAELTNITVMFRIFLIRSLIR